MTYIKYDDDENSGAMIIVLLLVICVLVPICIKQLNKSKDECIKNGGEFVLEYKIHKCKMPDNK